MGSEVPTAGCPYAGLRPRRMRCSARGGRAQWKRASRALTGASSAGVVHGERKRAARTENRGVRMDGCPEESITDPKLMSNWATKYTLVASHRITLWPFAPHLQCNPRGVPEPVQAVRWNRAFQNPGSQDLLSTLSIYSNYDFYSNR
jgi:hypothetical protein